MTGEFGSVSFDDVRAGIQAAIAAEPIPVPRALLVRLVDPEPCEFDHHGGCQAHSYLSLKPGGVCPQQAVKDLLAEDGGT